MGNPYNLQPGGVVEEIEEGGTLPIVAATVADGDVTHKHYHLGRGRDRRRGRSRDFMREYASLTRERDRNDGVLGLVDRERDRELDRNMVDREVASRRDMRMMGLLDRERERDRGGTDVMNLLERELERRRDLRPSNDSAKESKVREACDSDDDGDLKAEIEALREDFKRLMKSPPAIRSGKALNRGSGRASGTSLRSRVAGLQRPGAAVEIQFGCGDDAEDNRDGDKAAQENEDNSSSSARVTQDVSGQDIRRAGRSLRRASRRDGVSDSEES